VKEIAVRVEDRTFVGVVGAGSVFAANPPSTISTSALSCAMRSGEPGRKPTKRAWINAPVFRYGEVFVNSERERALSGFPQNSVDAYDSTGIATAP